MQWWNALTGQFAQLATSAMKDTATDAAKTLAGKMMKQSFDAAAETVSRPRPRRRRRRDGRGRRAKALAPEARAKRRRATSG